MKLDIPRFYRKAHYRMGSAFDSVYLYEYLPADTLVRQVRALTQRWHNKIRAWWYSS